LRFSKRLWKYLGGEGRDGQYAGYLSLLQSDSPAALERRECGCQLRTLHCLWTGLSCCPIKAQSAQQMSFHDLAEYCVGMTRRTRTDKWWAVPTWFKRRNGATGQQDDLVQRVEKANLSFGGELPRDIAPPYAC